MAQRALISIHARRAAKKDKPTLAAVQRFGGNGL